MGFLSRIFSFLSRPVRPRPQTQRTGKPAPGNANCVAPLAERREAPPIMPDLHERIKGFQARRPSKYVEPKVVEEFVDAVRGRIVREQYELPMLPQATLDVQNILNSPRAEIAEITGVISRDQVLAARLLKTANSAFYRGVYEITDVHQAIVRIGLRQMRSMMLTISAQSVILKGKLVLPMARKLWEHSITCGVFARELAELTARDQDKFFLAGLLHDIGKVIVLDAVDAVSRKMDKFMPPKFIIKDLFDEYHQELGAKIAQKWGLPEDLVATMAAHHNVPEDEEAEYKNEIAIVATANELCRQAVDVEALTQTPVYAQAGLANINPVRLQKEVDKWLLEIRGRLSE